MVTAVREAEVVDLKDNQAFDRFDRVCNRHMKISGYEFIKRYRSGVYNDVDVDSVSGLSKVLSILPFAGL
jgi:hypothetical protein